GREAGPGPAPAGELQLLEQERLELLRRIQTELVSDGGEGLLFDPCDLTRELLTEIAQVRDVNRDTSLFHLDEHVDERQLHVAIQTLEVQPHELVRELFAEPSRRGSAGAGARVSIGELGGT